MELRSVNMHQCPYDEGATCVDAPSAPEDCWEDRDKQDKRCETYTVYQQREYICFLETELAKERNARADLVRRVERAIRAADACKPLSVEVVLDELRDIAKEGKQ